LEPKSEENFFHPVANNGKDFYIVLSIQIFSKIFHIVGFLEYRAIDEAQRLGNSGMIFTLTTLVQRQFITEDMSRPMGDFRAKRGRLSRNPCAPHPQKNIHFSGSKAFFFLFSSLSPSQTPP
jgi:hypothetical protein